MQQYQTDAEVPLCLSTLPSLSCGDIVGDEAVHKATIFTKVSSEGASCLWRWNVYLLTSTVRTITTSNTGSGHCLPPGLSNMKSWFSRILFQACTLFDCCAGSLRPAFRSALEEQVKPYSLQQAGCHCGQFGGHLFVDSGSRGNSGSQNGINYVMLVSVGQKWYELSPAG